MINIYIVILNYNGLEDTLKCLHSLPKLYIPRCNIHTIVVDNGSTDHSIDQLVASNIKIKNMHIIDNQKNLGFAKGNNKGINYALNHGADYILLLNNDTQILDNFLPSLLNLNKDVSSPVVKFRTLPGSVEWYLDYGGYINWWTGRTTHLNENTLHGEIKKSKYIDVDYIAGCCMLIKREVFESIGYFNESYFIYFEDVDFCVTAKKNGFSVVVDPHTKIYHKLGGSMDRWSKRAIYYNLLGNLIFITKHLGWRKIIGYSYLFILTLKIIKDRLINRFKYDIRSYTIQK